MTVVHSARRPHAQSFQPEGRTQPIIPQFIQFRPHGGARLDIWTVRLDAEILTLLKPGDESVMILHREEAARYLRFSCDLLRGRTLTFTVTEGLKSYSFPCSRAQMLKLIAWLPHKETSEIAKEVRVSGVGVVLFGLLHLILAQDVWLGWGVALIALGLSGVYAPRRGMYGTNGALMLVTGLGDLAAASFSGSGGTPGAFDPALIPVAVGILLIIWGIHQLSMLGPNQLIRAARAVRDRQAAVQYQPSTLVRRIGIWNAGASIAFGIYAAVLWILASSNGVHSEAAIVERTLDLIAFGVLSVTSAAAAAVLFLRRRPAYFEAKVSAQMLVGVFVLSLWGISASIISGHPVSALGRAFSLDRASAAPAAWVLLILWVWVFNHWFNEAVDRELEAQRD